MNAGFVGSTIETSVSMIQIPGLFLILKCHRHLKDLTVLKGLNFTVSFLVFLFQLAAVATSSSGPQNTVERIIVLKIPNSVTDQTQSPKDAIEVWVSSGGGNFTRITEEGVRALIGDRYSETPSQLYRARPNMQTGFRPIEGLPKINFHKMLKKPHRVTYADPSIGSSAYKEQPGVVVLLADGSLWLYPEAQISKEYAAQYSQPVLLSEIGTVADIAIGNDVVVVFKSDSTVHFISQNKILPAGFWQLKVSDSQKLPSEFRTEFLPSPYSLSVERLRDFFPRPRMAWEDFVDKSDNKRPYGKYLRANPNGYFGSSLPKVPTTNENISWNWGERVSATYLAKALGEFLADDPSTISIYKTLEGIERVNAIIELGQANTKVIGFLKFAAMGPYGSTKFLETSQLKPYVSKELEEYAHNRNLLRIRDLAVSLLTAYAEIDPNALLVLRELREQSKDLFLREKIARILKANQDQTSRAKKLLQDFATDNRPPICSQVL